MSVPRRKSINPFAGLERPGTTSTSTSTPNDTPAKASTSRTSFIHSQEATSLPSRSASTPFDWDAVRSGKPPPYPATPFQRRNKGRQSLVPPPGTPDANVKRCENHKRMIRRRSLMERILNYPSQFWYEIEEALSLLAERSAGRALGGIAHLLHFIARWKQLRSRRDEDMGWYDMYEESSSWFHWASLLSFSLFALSILAAFYFFTRVRIYRLHHHMKPGETETRLVDSPHARFVGNTETFTTIEEPTPWSRAWAFIKHLLLTCWLFLLNHEPEETPKLKGGKSQVQELEVWTPKEAEKAFFTIYSPMHSLLWLAWDRDNWLLVTFIMVFCAFQLNALILAYGYLISDKAILSAELMNEYDQKFVFPRVFPVRHDACTQTHEAEMVVQDHWTPSRHNHAKTYRSY